MRSSPSPVTGGGKWRSHDPWGRRRLAYEIDHKAEGVYHLLVFEASAETLAEVTRILKITDGVMRHLSTRRPMPHRRAPAPVGGGEEYAPPTEAESEGGA